MTRYYLDTSVAVHALMGTSAAAAWFDGVNATPTDRLVSSRLLRTELTRALRREGQRVADRDVILEKVEITPITEAILTSAEAIHARLRTLDSIHLASALAFGSDTVVTTHDAALKAAVDGVGLSWTDPLEAHRDRS